MSDNSFDIENASVEFIENPENLLRKYTKIGDQTIDEVCEKDNQLIIRTGNNMFDALYALAHHEVVLNSKESIQDGAFNNNCPIRASVFQAGEKWSYVWTRDISYSVQLALANVDPRRSKNSLVFKLSYLKSCGNLQIAQDTGSGGSYPISTDRVVWAIAAYELLKYLEGRSRSEFLNTAYEAITNTIEHDRKTVFDDIDGLYKGEQSFLDWREQSYPQWTWNDTIKIGISKALSTNILHYKILDIASKLAEEKGLSVESTRYSGWADELKQNIDKKFYLKGLYSTMIFGDTCPITMQTYDLLGNALAVIYGIADAQQSDAVVSGYPHTKISAPVVFPQRRKIYNDDKGGEQKPYHNRAIWPFVTTYWIKAAAKVKNPSVVDHGVNFLMTQAAVNLSNMENFEYLNGNTDTAIDSRCQLWSGAGYIAMVHDVVFGLDVDQKGIRFSPFITNEMCKMFTKNNNNIITLTNFFYRGKKISVEIKLPVHQESKKGYYKIEKISLNGNPIGNDYIDWSKLKDTNTFKIDLLDFDDTPKNIRLLPDDGNDNEHWSPPEPNIEPITTLNGKLQIIFKSEEKSVNIYRNGILKVPGYTKKKWVDFESSDYHKNTYFYAVQAVNDKGNVSFPSPTVYYEANNNLEIIEVKNFKNVGGEYIEEGVEHVKAHYRNWGDRFHTLELDSFKPGRSGNYKVSLYYGNGAGHIGTGITCSVKKISIRENDTGVIQEGIVEMPHLGTEKKKKENGELVDKTEFERWDKWGESSILNVKLDSSKTYEIKIFEDKDCLNMSFFSHFSLYTGNGGGSEPYNNVNISQMRLLLEKEE